MKQYTITIIIILSCLTSCNNAKPSLENKEYITVIFHNTPNHTSTDRGIGHSTTLPSTIFNYVDTNGVLQYYVPKMLGNDTLVIPSHNGYAEVMHRNQSIEDNYYLLQAADTVLFTYAENSRPQIKSLCFQDNTWLYTIPEHDNQTIHQQTGYSIKTLCTSRLYGAMWFALNNPNYKSNKSKQQILDRYRKICPNIDSLQFLLADLDLSYNNYIDSLLSHKKLSKLYADFYRKMGNRHNIEEILHSDSLLLYPSSHYAIKGILMSKSPEEIIAFSQDTTISKRARFSVIDYMLRINREHGSAFPLKIVESCNVAYEELCGVQFEKESQKRTPIKAETGSLVIEDLNGNQTTFDKVLNQYRGNVIYVDLWASWCAPCRASMPDAEKLRKEYADKDVAFIYIAINDQTTAWKNAIVEYYVATEGGINYIAINPKEAIFLKEIDNRYIPQYLLYDKSGKLIDAHAPKPSTQEIREVINSLLK